MVGRRRIWVSGGAFYFAFYISFVRNTTQRTSRAASRVQAQCYSGYLSMHYHVSQTSAKFGEERARIRTFSR